MQPSPRDLDPTRNGVATAATPSPASPSDDDGVYALFIEELERLGKRIDDLEADTIRRENARQQGDEQRESWWKFVRDDSDKVRKESRQLREIVIAQATDIQEIRRRLDELETGESKDDDGPGPLTGRQKMILEIINSSALKLSGAMIGVNANISATSAYQAAKELHKRGLVGCVPRPNPKGRASVENSALFYRLEDTETQEAATT